MIFRDIQKERKGEVRLSGLLPGDGQKIEALKSEEGREMKDITTRSSVPTVVETTKETKNILVHILTNRIDRKKNKALFVPQRTCPRFFAASPRVSLFAFLGVGVFLCLLVFITMNTALATRDVVKGHMINGVRGLLHVAEEGNMENISSLLPRIEMVQQDFQSGLEEIRKLSRFSQFLSLEGTDIQSFYALLQAGNAYVSGLQKYAYALHSIQTVLRDISTKSIDVITKEYGSVTEALRTIFSDITEGTRYIATGSDFLSSVSLLLFPDDLKQSLSYLQKKSGEIVSTMKQMETYFPLLLNVFGNDHPRTYMVILQNRDEMRPTGGFIGSLVFLTFDKGWITDMTFKDIYELDWRLKENIPPPYGLSPLTNRYAMRDSNYSPDFFIAGREISSFLAKEEGPEIDGIIALNQGIIIDLLEKTGPVAVKTNGKPAETVVFDRDNFSFLLSYIVESKLNKSAPKDMLAKFIPLFSEALKQIPAEDIASIILQHIAERNIALYSSREDFENAIADVGLDGRLGTVDAGKDYFLLAEASVSGNKSDRYIDQRISHHTFIDNEGKVVNQVSIEREHTFSSEEETRWDNWMKKTGFSPLHEDMKRLLGKGENISYIRMYVPSGSKLLEVEGIPSEDVRVEEELGKTVFGFYMRVYAQNIRKVIVRYTLPFTLDTSQGDAYSLLVQKQVGGESMSFDKEVYVDNDLVIQKSFPVEKPKEGPFAYRDILKNSLYVSMMVGKR